MMKRQTTWGFPPRRELVHSVDDLSAEREAWLCTEVRRLHSENQLKGKRLGELLKASWTELAQFAGDMPEDLYPALRTNYIQFKAQDSVILSGPETLLRIQIPTIDTAMCYPNDKQVDMSDVCASTLEVLIRFISKHPSKMDFFKYNGATLADLRRVADEYLVSHLQHELQGHAFDAAWRKCIMNNSQLVATQREEFSRTAWAFRHQIVTVQHYRSRWKRDTSIGSFIDSDDEVWNQYGPPAFRIYWTSTSYLQLGSRHHNLVSTFGGQDLDPIGTLLLQDPDRQTAITLCNGADESIIVTLRAAQSSSELENDVHALLRWIDHDICFRRALERRYDCFARLAKFYTFQLEAQVRDAIENKLEPSFLGRSALGSRSHSRYFRCKAQQSRRRPRLVSQLRVFKLRTRRHPTTPE